MLSLIWKIGADMNPFRKAISSIPDEAKAVGKAAGTALGNAMGGQIKGVLLSYVGLGAIKQALTQSIQDAQRTIAEATKSGMSVEGIQEVKKVAAITGLTSDEVAKGLKDDPVGFRKLVVDGLSQSGGVDSTRTVNQLNEVGELGQSLWTGSKKGSAEIGMGLLSGAEGGFSRIWWTLGNLLGNDWMKNRGKELGNSSHARYNKYWGGGDDAAPSDRVRLANEFASKVQDSVAKAELEKVWDQMGGNDVKSRPFLNRDYRSWINMPDKQMSDEMDWVRMGGDVDWSKYGGQFGTKLANQQLERMIAILSDRL